MLTQIKRLYEFEMYADVLSVVISAFTEFPIQFAYPAFNSPRFQASLLHTIAENDRSTLTYDQEYQLYLFEANAFYFERRFRCAELHYRLALQAKQFIMKQKNAFNAVCIDAINEYFPEPELKYRMAVSLQEIQQTTDAIKLLQSIPFKQRTPKINFLLAKLQHHNMNSKAAVNSYTDVLRECPLSLEAIRCLLELGTNGIEVNSLIVNGKSAIFCCTSYLF